MVLSKKKISFSSTSLINYVFAFFPISFIFGNLFTNINIIIFCVLGIFHLRSNILKIKLNLPIKIIFFLFLWIFFTTSLSFVKSLYFEGYDNDNLIRLIKSIAFFRYFLMLIIIYLLNEYEVLNFKYFFVTAACSALLISLDIIYQYFFGFNIIGLKSQPSHNSSFFGEELIAGGFILDFAFFSIFFLTCLLKNKNIYRYLLTTIAICILGAGILLSGNKMPLILFLFGVFLIFLFHNKLRKIIFLSLLSLFILFKFIISSNDELKGNYSSSYDNIVVGEVVPRISVLIPPSILSKFPLLKNYIEDVKKVNEEAFLQSESIETTETKDQNIPKVIYGKSAHKQLIFTAIDTWSGNKIFGNGLRSFRKDCRDDSNSKLSETTNLSENQRRCSTHPHNYYIEILTETGIVGISLVLIIAIIFVIFIFKNFTFLKGDNLKNSLVLSGVISLFIEVFPIQTTGSIFTTNDTTYIILISSIILINKKLIIKENLQ